MGERADEARGGSGVMATVVTPSDFVMEIMCELRESGYRPAGWRRFLARSWRQSRTTARAHPRLVRDWRRASAWLLCSTLAALVLDAALAGARLGPRDADAEGHVGAD